MHPQCYASLRLLFLNQISPSQHLPPLSGYDKLLIFFLPELDYYAAVLLPLRSGPC
jgi:hypothetical protein